MNEPPRKPRSISIDKWTFDIEEYSEGGEVNQGEKKHVVGVGWVPHGGIVMRNVYHGGFRLAYDVGVTGIWVFPGPKSRANHKPKYLVLGPPDFIQLDELYHIMKPAQTFDVVRPIKNADAYDGFSAVNNMSVFNASTKGELVVRWRSNLALFDKESGYLFVTQRFILSDYDAEPPHEPAGALKATRLHPITRIHYQYSRKGWVDSFRVDYRIYANLDSWWYQRLPPAAQWLGRGNRLFEGRGQKKKGRLDNSAGLFKDDDSNSAFPSGTTPEEVVFEAAEKPLKYEVIASGLDPALGRKVWDNIHWWGVNIKDDSVSPSTPGAFHALHMHWRWGKALQIGAWWWTPEHAGEAQFKGRGKGGILVDPRIDKQKLMLAVIVNKGLPDDLNTHSSEVFEDFFKKSRGKESSGKTPPDITPADITKGEDLVLYYSVEVPTMDPSFREEYNQWQILLGEVFVHGLFFAHEPEAASWRTGAPGPLYLRPPESDILPGHWVRNPQVKE